MSKKERRQFIRFNIDMDLKFQIEGQGGSDADLLTGICTNLSIEGLCMCCNHNLKSGDKLNMEIILPAEEGSVHLKGVVCWCRLCKGGKDGEFEVGVKLFTISKNEETRFILFVCELMKHDLVKYINAARN
ncbi:MAG: PilZ domain-containing protein [Candidatus Omnitrophica bacterium]|nr:PilZ domain-containing protein [Candidatus Omnitrophota bacterium]